MNCNNCKWLNKTDWSCGDHCDKLKLAMKSKHETRDWYGEDINIDYEGLNVNPKTFYCKHFKERVKCTLKI